jgi:hypothetical protein
MWDQNLPHAGMFVEAMSTGINEKGRSEGIDEANVRSVEGYLNELHRG